METFHLSDYAKGIFIFGDLQTREELERVPEGLVVILDAANWNIGLIPKISLTTMKKYFDYCQVTNKSFNCQITEVKYQYNMAPKLLQRNVHLWFAWFVTVLRRDPIYIIGKDEFVIF